MMHPIQNMVTEPPKFSLTDKIMYFFILEQKLPAYQIASTCLPAVRQAFPSPGHPGSAQSGLERNSFAPKKSKAI